MRRSANVGGGVNLAAHLASADPGVASIILAIAEESKRIRTLFLAGAADARTRNASGEAQLELEKEADRMLIAALRTLPAVQAIATEEQEGIIETGRQGLSVALDPVDGSSCIRTNLSVGTIAGIFSGSLVGPLQPVAALYVLYGPLTTLVCTAGRGAHEFVLSGEGYVLRRADIRVPEGKLLAPGGLRRDFTPAHRALVEDCESRGFKLRYTGSFTADISQILEYGGFYCYPALRQEPAGKLRLLFEAMPMAFLLQQAGGYASDGREPILSLRAEQVHQRVPLYIGSHEVVKRIRV
ncbi:MAG: fructose-1,6-bisphosphatase [Candidatus Aenigmarchaeota archaeon]|nr:fructose-1,6-bisphosphatase [Candidatus Aenigmarchaeota archaeon]